jgi:glycosyltransferase involved in cell wall biosynthesis
MKIVFVLPFCETSGGTRCASVVAEGLLRRGHEVRILREAPDSLDAGGIARRTWSALLRAPDWLKGFSGEIDSFRKLDRQSFQRDEIVVGFGMRMSCQVGLLESLPNLRVQYLHGSTPWNPGLREKTLGCPLPKIVVASYLKELVETTGKGKVLAVVPNGVDFLTYYRAVPETDRSGVGTIYSSHVAKDPNTILAVVRNIRRARPKLPVRIFGDSRRPKQLPRDTYHRYPSLKEARKIYSRSQVWILASRAEGFGLPVLEAMACGCAVVATDCGGPRDLIRNGETGFLVPIGDVRAITDRVLALADDANVRERIQRNSLEAVKQFSWERCILRLEAALRKATTSEIAVVGDKQSKDALYQAAEL